ncbi:MAG: hypothetical protein ABIP54_03625 [Candidatus Andersenbacteria bacterium]
MSLERFNQSYIESREDPAFDLNIIVHRHGPKEGMTGTLSVEGRQATEDYFSEAYKGIEFDGPEDGVDIEYSPIHRTRETADIYSSIIQKNGIGKIRSTHEDERLSEGSVAEHPELIESYGGKKGKWLTGWMETENRPLPDVKTGQQAATGFCEWLLEKVSIRKHEGGKQEVDAFSHGPVIVAFLIQLEKKMNTKILPEHWQDTNIFEGSANYLRYINFHANSSAPDRVSLFFNDKKIEIPLELLGNMARESQS